MANRSSSATGNIDAGFGLHFRQIQTSLDWSYVLTSFFYSKEQRTGELECGVDVLEESCFDLPLNWYKISIVFFQIVGDSRIDVFLITICGKLIKLARKISV